MRALLILLVLTTALAACADGTVANDAPTDDAPDGAASTDTATAAPPPPPSSAPTGPATSTTPVPIEGDGDIGDGAGAPAPLAEPPDFGVSSDTDSDSFPPYTSCWNDGSGADICSDGVPQADRTLDGGDRLVVTYAEGDLTATANAAGSPGTGPPEPAGATVDLPVVQENPGIWIVDTTGLNDGAHDVFLSWRGEQGDAVTAFTLLVG